MVFLWFPSPSLSRDQNHKFKMKRFDRKMVNHVRVVKNEKSKAAIYIFSMLPTLRVYCFLFLESLSSNCFAIVRKAFAYSCCCNNFKNAFVTVVGRSTYDVVFMSCENHRIIWESLLHMFKIILELNLFKFFFTTL